jgi:hypothetical protein
VYDYTIWISTSPTHRIAVSGSKREPTPVLGYLVQNPDGTVSIEGDRTGRKFPSWNEAAEALLNGMPAPPEQKGE